MFFSRSLTITLLTFLESFAVTLVQRAIYFYTRERLGYSDEHNLWLAFFLGVAYVAGARLSHRLAGRGRERRLLMALVAVQLTAQLVMLACPSGAVLVLGVITTNFLDGIKWPVVESYVSAGLAPAQASRAIGKFNLAWASSVSVAMICAGPLIELWAGAIFLAAAVLKLANLGLLAALEKTPVHMPLDHPERPRPEQLHRYRTLLTSSRWALIDSYVLLFLLNPLLPGIFQKLGVSVRLATGLAALIDLMRFVSFLVMRRYPGWHGRMGPVLASVLSLPVGFCLMLFSSSVSAVLLGELIYGLAAGMGYYAALYYALVVKNASVDAGGTHESLIGLGFSLGPLVGLAGTWLAGPLGGPFAGMAAVVVPLILIATAAGLAPLLKHR